MFLLLRVDKLWSLPSAAPNISVKECHVSSDGETTSPNFVRLFEIIYFDLYSRSAKIQHDMIFCD